MAEFRDMLVKHIEDTKKAKKALEAKVKELEALQNQIKDLDDDIKLSEKFLAESKSGRRGRGRPKKQPQKRGARIDRSQLRNDVLNTIRNAGSAGIARGDLIATVGIKGDKRAEGYLGNYLSELQKNGTVGRGPAAEGKAYGPYVHADHSSGGPGSSSGFSSSSF